MDRGPCLFSRARCSVRRWVLLAWLPGALRTATHQLVVLGAEDQAQPSARHCCSRCAPCSRLDLRARLGARAARERRDPDRSGRPTRDSGRRMSHRQPASDRPRTADALAPGSVRAMRAVHVEAPTPRLPRCAQRPEGRLVLGRLREEPGAVRGSRPPTRRPGRGPRRGEAKP